MLNPSCNNEPNANASAVPKSIPLPYSIDYFLYSYILLTYGWTVRSDGNALTF